MVCSDGLNEVTDMIPLKKEVVEDDRAIVISLMRVSQLTLAPLIEREDDIYNVDDLKVRFR